MPTRSSAKWPIERVNQPGVTTVSESTNATKRVVATIAPRLRAEAGPLETSRRTTVAP